jgi:hypothetical protein
MVTDNTLGTTNYYCDVQQPSNMLNLYPDTTRRSVLRWTAPAAGTATVSGQFQGLSIEGATTNVALAYTSGSSTTTLINNTLSGGPG